MRKKELVDAIASNADIPRKSASEVLDAILDAITEALKEGEEVTLVGFGTFSVKERSARTGRNPQTGEPIVIAAASTVGFSAGKNLKAAVGDPGTDDPGPSKTR